MATTAPLPPTLVLRQRASTVVVVAKSLSGRVSIAPVAVQMPLASLVVSKVPPPVTAQSEVVSPLAFVVVGLRSKSVRQ